MICSLATKRLEPRAAHPGFRTWYLTSPARNPSHRFALTDGEQPKQHRRARSIGIRGTKLYRRYRDDSGGRLDLDYAAVLHDAIQPFPAKFDGNGNSECRAEHLRRGTSTTTITDNVASGSLMVVALTYPQIFEIGQINIVPFSTSTTLANPLDFQCTSTSSGAAQIRLTNITFGVSPLLWGPGTGSQSAQVTRYNNCEGVYDHNTIPAGSDAGYSNASFGNYKGVGGYGDYSWAQPDTWGTADCMYYENNIGTNAGDEGSFVDNEAGADGATGIGGSRVCVRYNHVTQTGAASGLVNYHGLDSGGRARGGRTAETYSNTITCANSGGCGYATQGPRSGSGISVANTMIPTSANFGSFIAISSPDPYRRFASFSPWNSCDGLSPFDTNDGVTYNSGTITSIGNSYTVSSGVATAGFSSGSGLTINVTGVDSGGGITAATLGAGGTGYLSGGSGTAQGYINSGDHTAYITVTVSTGVVTALVAVTANTEARDSSQSWTTGPAEWANVGGEPYSIHDTTQDVGQK